MTYIAIDKKYKKKRYFKILLVLFTYLCNHKKSSLKTDIAYCIIIQKYNKSPRYSPKTFQLIINLLISVLNINFPYIHQMFVWTFKCSSKHLIG